MQDVTNGIANLISDSGDPQRLKYSVLSGLMRKLRSVHRITFRKYSQIHIEKDTEQMSEIRNVNIRGQHVYFIKY